MKYLKLVVVPLVLYLVGTMVGPLIGSFLVSEAQEDTSLQRDVKVNDMVFPVNLAEMRDAELPQTLKTIGQIILPAVSGDGSMTIPPGRTVKLLNRNEKMLIIETTDGLAKGEVEVSQTDIFESIGRQMMEEAIASAASASGNAPAPEKASAAPPTASPPAVPAAKPETPVLAAVVDPVPSSEPERTEPVAEPEPVSSGPLDEEGIVAAMKKSVADGAVKEFKVDQVEAWKAAEEEDFAGEKFQTGLAAYKAETIFGVKTVQAKALIKNGKVFKWVYAKTGMEIR